MCRQNLSPMEYPPAPDNELSPYAVEEGLCWLIWAIGDSQRLPESGSSFSQKNSILWRIFLLMMYLCFKWWTIVAKHLRAKDMFQAWSFNKQRNESVRRDSTMSRNSFGNHVSSCLFTANACAMDSYKCVRRWSTQVTLSARCPSFPASCCASCTIKDQQFTCQGMLIKSQSLETYFLGMATLRLFVLMIRPSIINIWPTTSSNHLSMARGHCQSAVSGSPITTKIASMSAASTRSICARQSASKRELSKKMQAFCRILLFSFVGNPRRIVQAIARVIFTVGSILAHQIISR